MATRGEDIFDGFIQGAKWGIPQMFGIEPPKQAQEAMMKAPLASFAGELLSGTVIPYAGWAKTTTKVPQLIKWVDKAGEFGGIQNPVARRAAREVGRFAPLEAARVGTAGAMEVFQPFGDVNMSEVLTSAVANLALEGAGGAVIGKLAEAGVAKKRGHELIGEDAYKLPPTLQLRKLDEMVATVPQNKVPEYQNYMKQMSELVYENQPLNKEFITPLVEGQDQKLLNNIYSGQDIPNITSHRLHRSETFGTEADAMNVMGSIGIDAQRADRYMLTPRFIKFESENVGNLIEKHIKNNMTDIGDGWYKADEIDDGFKLLARRVQPGKEAGEFGGMFMTKTDLPDWFRGGTAERLNKAMEENIWSRMNYRLSGGGGQMGARAIEAYQLLPFRTSQLIAQGGVKFDTVSKVGGVIQKGVRATDPIRENKLIRAATDYAKRVITPTRFQFKNNPRANLVFGLASKIKEDADTTAKELLYGRIKPVKGKSEGGPVGNNLISRENAIAEGQGFMNDGPINALDAMSEQEFQDLHKWAAKQTLDPTIVRDAEASGAMTKPQALFLQRAEQMRQYLMKESAENGAKFGAKKWNDYPYAFLTKTKDGTPPAKKDFKDKLERQVHDWTGDLSNNILDHMFIGEQRLVKMENFTDGKILDERMTDLKGEMRKFAKAINHNLAPLLGPQGASDIAQGVNQVMYSLTLAGINAGYLVMNPIGVMTNVVPRAMMVINGRGLGLGDDMRDWPVPGVGTIGIWDGLKAMKQTTKDIMNPDPTMIEMFNRAAAEGKLALGMVAEEVGTKAPSWKNIKQNWQDGAYFKAMNSTWNILAARSEQYSRLIAFTTSVRLARAAGLTNPDHIYRLAVKITDDAMYGYRQADKAAFMTGPVGGPLGLFKNWTLNFVGDTMEYATDGLMRNHWQPLLWQQASVMAIAGLKASPIGAIAAMFNNMFSDEDLVTNMYSMFGEESATGMAYGLPTYLGFSLTPSGSAPGANPAHDIQQFMEPVMFDRIRALFQTGGAAWSAFKTTGEHPADNPEVRRAFVEAVAPRTMTRLVQSFMMGDDLTSSKTGYPLIKDPSLAQRVMYTMGLTSKDMQKRSNIADILYKDKQRRMAMIAGYGEAYKDAIEAKDSIAQWRLLKQASADGIDLGSVAKSAAQRLRQGDLDMIERAQNPQYQRELMRAFGLSS